jgi:hypothetical protein
VVLLKIGTMPYSSAMRLKATWQSGEGRESGDSPVQPTPQ